MIQKSPAKKQSSYLRLSILAALLVAAAWLLRHDWPTVRRSLAAARQADIRWLAGAVGLTVVTYCIAAAIYNTLALKQLRYRETLLVEVSTAFVNRLLPSGAGGLGLHGLYLSKRKHTAAEATVVVSANNLLGMAAHLLLLALLVALRPQIIGNALHQRHIGVSWQLFAAIAIVLIILYFVPVIRLKLTTFAKHLLVSLHKLRLPQIWRAAALAALLTLTYTTILLCTARAVDIHLGLLRIFVVFSVGMLTSTVTPTPGGLVGAEAGLFAGFVAYGVPAAPAGAAVLLYRLATYWLPLVPGVIALAAARQRKLV